jgi:ABC-type multidrug transport system permease subunit
MHVKTTLRVIRKNIKLLVRSKGSALIVIFGPLLVIFLVGIAFDNSNQYNVKIGAFSEKYSDLSNSILNQLNNKDFRVTRYNTQGECIEAIKQSQVHMCMFFSKDFQISKPPNNEISFSIDYSKINLVWMILESMSQEVENKSSSISLDLTNVLLQKLDATQKEIAADKTLIAKITEGSNRVNNEIVAIDKSLVGLEFRMDMENFPVRTLVNRTNMIRILAGDTARQSKDLINGIRSDLQEMNASGGSVDGMVTLMDQAKEKINNLTRKIENQSRDVSAMSSGLQKNIDDLKKRMDSAGNFKQSTISKLAELKKVLETNINTIMAVQSSFNKIENNIQNIQVKNAEDIVTPIKTTINPISSKGTHLNYIFPSLIVLVVMFISLLLASTLVIMEKTSKAFFRNFITPTKDIVFVFATYLTSMLLILVQLVIILIVAAFFFKSQFISAVLPTTLILLIAGTLFTLIGMTIGYLFNSEETSTLAAISCGSVLLFMSGVILPIESMPQYLMEIAQYNPFVISEGLLRKAMIFHYPLSVMGRDILLLVGYSVFFLGAILATQKLMKRHFVVKYAKRFAPIKMKRKE